MAIGGGMKINLITAMDKNMGIGIDNSLPWKLPGELQYFKKMTLNSVILMGRKTLDSLPGILPQREHWILSTGAVDNDKIKVFNSIKDVFKEAKKRELKEIWVVGGAKIYEQMLPFVTDLWITEIEAETKSNRFFPSWNRREFNLESVFRGEKLESDQYSYTFFHWRRTLK
jgi:dihydrofolate reductase